MFKYSEFITIVAVKPCHGSKPHKIFIIFKDGVDLVIRKPIQYIICENYIGMLEKKHPIEEKERIGKGKFSMASLAIVN